MKTTIDVLDVGSKPLVLTTKIPHERFLEFLDEYSRVFLFLPASYDPETETMVFNLVPGKGQEEIISPDNGWNAAIAELEKCQQDALDNEKTGSNPDEDGWKFFHQGMECALYRLKIKRGDYENMGS